MKHLENRAPLWWLKAITTLMGVAYGFMFLFKLIRSYATLQASGLDVDLAVANNPQSMIALCYLMVVLAIWFLHGKSKLVAALGLYVALLAFFGYWAYSTSAVKVNAGLERIPGSGLVGNFWLGATWWLDPIVFLGTLAMAVLAARLLWVNYKSKDGTVRIGGGFANSHSRT